VCSTSEGQKGTGRNGEKLKRSITVTERRKEGTRRWREEEVERKGRRSRRYSCLFFDGDGPLSVKLGSFCSVV